MATDTLVNILPDGECKQWFVMRDLTRSNAKCPAYVLLEKLGVEYFTPMVWKITIRNGQHKRKRVPYIHDLIFVHDSRKVIDPIVERIPTFQYRFLRNAGGKPMTVREKDMKRFIYAIESSESPRYYRLDEIIPDMCRSRIRIIGGNLNGYEGNFISIRGSKVKRLLVELPGFMAAAVEVETEYIQLL